MSSRSSWSGKTIALLRGAIMGSRRGNEVIRALNAWQHARVHMVDGQDGAVKISDTDVVIEVPIQAGIGGSGGGAGWNWANPPEYDATKTYAANKVVVVSPWNSAVASGAGVGIWVCVLYAAAGNLPIPYPVMTNPATGQWLTGLHWVPVEEDWRQKLYSLVEFHFDYLVCRPDNGAEDGSNDIKVALEPWLRSSIAAQIFPSGEIWDYSAYDAASQSRLCTLRDSDPAVTETEYITPMFLAGDRIPVQPCANTSLAALGGNLTVIAAAIASGGSGYAVDDVLTIVGGAGVSATLTVATVNGSGAITSFSITTGGDYTIRPPSPATTSVLPAGGVGATFLVTMCAEMKLLAVTGRHWGKDTTPPA